jgi:serine/threonine-protein kinase RsbW
VAQRIKAQVAMEPLAVPGTLESLSAVREYVKAAAAQAGLDGRTTYRLVVAADEVASNIVTHGYEAAGRSGTVDVRAEMDERALTICLEDTGPAYEPDRIAPEDFERPLEERGVGGLGLFLAGHNVDQFRYERVGDRNRHTLVAYRRTR